MQPSLKVLPYNILHKCLLYLLYENCFNCHLLLLSHFSRVRLCAKPHRRQPTRLLCLQDSLGKNTGVGCHFLLQEIKYLLFRCNYPQVNYASYRISVPLDLIYEAQQRKNQAKILVRETRGQTWSKSIVARN